MKTSKAYYYQGKFKYLEGDGWPVAYREQYFQGFEMPTPYSEEIYQEALTSALKEAIDFEDQDRIKTKVIVSNFGDADITRYENGESLNHLFEECLYNIPEIEIKVVNRWIGHNEDSACTEPVARIKESSKSEEETEDVHNEAFDILQKYTGEEYWCDEVLEAMERYALQFKSHDDQSAWRDVYISFNKRDGLIAFAERMSQRFTITRKS